MERTRQARMHVHTWAHVRPSGRSASPAAPGPALPFAPRAPPCTLLLLACSGTWGPSPCPPLAILVPNAGRVTDRREWCWGYGSSCCLPSGLAACTYPRAKPGRAAPPGRKAQPTLGSPSRPCSVAPGERLTRAGCVHRVQLAAGQFSPLARSSLVLRKPGWSWGEDGRALEPLPHHSGLVEEDLPAPSLPPPRC